MQFCQSDRPKCTIVHSQKTICCSRIQLQKNSTCKHNLKATFLTSVVNFSATRYNIFQSVCHAHTKYTQELCLTLEYVSKHVKVCLKSRFISLFQKSEWCIRSDRWCVPVCYACKGCNLNSHFMHAGEWAKIRVFSLWRSDHCRRDWNGTVVGWLFSCHILPAAVTRPLSQARGLIQSQRRGHWLLPGLREETLGIIRGGVGRGRDISFRPFCNEIQRFKVNCLPNW